MLVVGLTGPGSDELGDDPPESAPVTPELLPPLLLPPLLLSPGLLEEEGSPLGLLLSPALLEEGSPLLLLPSANAFCTIIDGCEGPNSFGPDDDDDNCLDDIELDIKNNTKNAVITM